MIISVDAMGGDYGPRVTVNGALMAADRDLDIILVGDETKIREALGEKSLPGSVTIHHCQDVVGMDEPPLKSVKLKKDASIRVAFELVRQGRAEAVVSAGNSGATLAAGILTLGRIKGVERPGIAGFFPGTRGPVLVMDVGANIDCRPKHLLQFGVMAVTFVSSCMDVRNPRVGILSIGAEDGKGNELVCSAAELFSRSPLNFVGNVEGTDLFSGDVHVIVCDGFVGNIVLKSSEGMARTMSILLDNEFAKTRAGRTARFFARRSLDRFKRKMEYEEYGGAPMLGINGVGIVCHGGSTPRAIKNAIGLAARYVENRSLEKMTSGLRSVEAESPPL